MIDPADVANRLLEAQVAWNGGVDGDPSPDPKPLANVRQEIAGFTEEERSQLVEHAAEKAKPFLGVPHLTGHVAFWKWVVREAGRVPPF